MIDNNSLYSGRLRNMASVYLTNSDRMLLLYRQGNSIVSNMWIGSAGGHFENNEVNDAKACMLRELSEELALNESNLENLSLRYITIRYTDGEVRQNYYFFADFKASHSSLPQSNEGITQWFAFDALKSLPMPFTARYVIDHYLSIGRFDTALYGGIADESNVHFHKL